MKANLKGQGGIAGLLLMHGEKLGIAVVLIGAGYLVYSASGIDRLPDTRQADRLLEKVRATRGRVEDPVNNNWQNAVKKHPDSVKVAKPLIRNEAMTVVPEAYAMSGRSLNPAVITPSAPRTDPVLLAAEDVIARGGVGLLSFFDEEARKRNELIAQQEEERRERERAREQARLEQENATGRGGRPRGRAGEEDNRRGGDNGRSGRGVGRTASRGRGQFQAGDVVERAHWAVVVAKVPIKDQRGRYIDAFENARGYNEAEDFPYYIGFVVERAEVRRGQAELDWHRIGVYDAKGTPTPNKFGEAMKSETLRLLDVAMQKWAMGAETEVVDDRYLDPDRVLIYPLPPLVGRDWGAEATHPDIPLASDAMLAGIATEPIEEEPLLTTPGADANQLRFNAPNQQPGFGSGRGRTSGGRYGSDRGRGGWEMRGRGGEDRMGRGTRGARGPGQATLARGVDNWLLRFFDFTVEPGMKYKYHVQLVLFDPNQAPHVLPKDRDPAVQERIKNMPKVSPTALFTPWSKPSTTVSIPLSGSVRLAENTKASSGNLLGDDPQVKLLVESFEKDGRSDNWIQAAKEKEFSRGGVANFVDDADALVDGGYVDKVRSFKFFSGVTVLDVRGGERLGRDMIVPSRVLLMDPAGQLSVRRELDDALDVQTHRQTFAEPDDARPLGRGR